MFQKNKNSLLSSASNQIKSNQIKCRRPLVNIGFLLIILFTLFLISGCPETITVMGPTVTNTIISNVSGDLVVSNNTCVGSFDEAALSVSCSMDIALTAQPISEVGVILASSYAPVLVSNSLIFNSNNWSNLQRVYLIIQHDGNGSNRLSVPVVISAKVPDYLAVTNKEVASFTYEHAYCGDLRGNIPVIDGTPNSFFLSGDGSSNAPYVIPLMRGCNGFAFTYDPNYTNGAPDIYMRATGYPRRYFHIWGENTEVVQPEESRWDLAAPRTAGNDRLRFTEEIAQGENTFLSGLDTLSTNAVEDYVISASPSATKWLSKKTLFWTSDRILIPYIPPFP